jgi:hypothetical protein
MSSFDMVAEVCAGVEAQVPAADLRVVGGFAAAALLESCAIDPVEHVITLGSDADLPAVRDNGTKRDLDMMSLNTDPALYRPMLHTAVAASAGRLTISLFQAMADGTEHDYLRKNKHVIDATSGAQTHRVGPFEAAVPDAATTAWRVVLDSGQSFSVNEPRFHVISYAIRRLRGVHAKDAAKIAALQAKVRTIPGMYTEERNAQYAELERLAADIQAFQDMSLVAAARTYGFRVLASKVGSAFLTSKRVTTYYQRAEERKSDEFLRQLQA